MRNIFLLIVFGYLLFSCKSKKTEKKIEPETTVVTSTDTLKTVVNKDSILTQLTKAVLIAFKNNDFKALANYVGNDGIRFSPYAAIDSINDKVVTKGQLESWVDKKKQTVILWGTVDPTDEPIKGTLTDYVKRFVYDVDFLNPEQFKVNEFIGAGNTTNTLKAFYPGCDFTESHFSGFEKKYEGMDWRSVRLVFRSVGDKYFLVGVIHDQWTT